MTDNFYAPPHSIEAEQAVIGGLLLDDDSSERVQKVLAMLKPDSFYSRPHKILFEEITRMHREQKPVDGLTLFDELERKSLTASVGGFAYIAEIAKNTPSAANIVAYAMQVRETAMERYAINRMTEATELLYSRNGMTATQKYEAIQAIFTQLTDHAKTGSRRGLRSFGEVMEDWVSDLEKRFAPSGEQRGMSTGIPSLDRMLSPKGLVKGSLFVIGARPKMGKTTLYSQMAINCAVHEKKPALMFSLEMPGDQILEKLVGQKSGVNPNIFYLPATNDADDGYQGDYDGDFNRAIETANRLSEIDLLYIDDTPGLSLAQIVSESRRIKREKGCVGMILVDYRAIDFIYEGNQITCGDKLESVTGKLQFDISSQYDKQQEHLLFTPLFKADNARVFDLEVESSTGVAQYADRLFLSATTDGINYGREQMIEQNEPFVYDKRVLWKRVGRIRKNVGFKLRVITKSPVTLSGCQIRIE
ncbi:packaged DNA stabilization protein [Escherichia coli]